MPDAQATIRSTREERAAAVMKQHAALTRNRRRLDGAKNVALLGLSVGLAWAVWNNNRLAEKAASRDAVYAMVQPNGEVISSMHFNEVAQPVQQVAAVQNSLWQYIQARDCYNTPGFVRQAYISQAMSDLRVGAQVHRAFDPANPLAPQHVYGEHGISVQCELVDPPTSMGNDGDIYFFRFRRWLDDGHVSKEAIAAAPFYSVSIRFRTGIYPKDASDPRRAWFDKTTFNAPGVQVIDYPGATPDNARPPVKVSMRNSEG